MIEFQSVSKRADEAVVGELKYGTIIRGVEGHRDSVYSKVNKRCLGQGLELEWPQNYCVLLNLRTGSLRAIPGSAVVSVLDCHATISETNNMPAYKKGGC